MLDNLQLPDSSALKVETQNWLLHSILRGDVHRLLDPILMMLLDPATARVSVLHVRIQQHADTTIADPSSIDDKTPKIYAISSVDGNVIYHVSEKCKGEVKPGKAKRVFVQTTLAGQDFAKNSKYVTEKKGMNFNDEMGDPYQTHSKNLNILQNISLFVNPFSRDGFHKPESINTDFDDYYEDHREHQSEIIGKAIRFSGSDLDKSKSKSIEGSNRLGTGDEKRNSKIPKVQRNNSFSSLEHEISRTDSNQTTKSSIDLLQMTSLTDTIFTKVSDGESFEKSRNGRGSVSSEGLATALNSDGAGELVRSWSFPGKDTVDTCEPDESTSAEDYFKTPSDSGYWNSMKSSEGWSVVEEVMNDLLDRVAILAGEVDVSTILTDE